ncbi:hypothetical protein ASG17_06385 [Brevundimonas sp. Leaf363]|uniref:glycoside hydrolase n=1 Tax=Brevundimonas sp. Leaf363 TaxID=1736353 RepID=UPI0007014BA5|nr:glycoside hydrolase [Brevundimonas sp. Leaf363]KQS55692.1 hypothetical protein ASG17_06385 [Brevundimonas sp. Leaf363]
MRVIGLVMAAALSAWAGAAGAETLAVRVGAVTYSVDPATLRIDADDNGATVPILPPVHDVQAVRVRAAGDGWRWTDGDGRDVAVSPGDGVLNLSITGAAGTKLSLPMPAARDGTWVVPDGEGMAYRVQDAFWRARYAEEHCLGGTTLMSLPAWTHLSETRAVTYALSQGLKSELCLHDDAGLQAGLKHDFAEGAETVALSIAVGPPDPLAPALLYRRLIQGSGEFRSFADKAMPDLPRLFGAPHAYVWGTARDIGFLDDLQALGIERLVISYDQDPRVGEHLVRPGYLAEAYRRGYLAGPYESFDNGQPADTADTHIAIWPADLYPSGCVIKADGAPETGFGGRGCYMSTEAIRRYPGPFIPGQRFAAHKADGASQVFLDVDAFGGFFEDHSPDHPLTMAQDRDNRLARMGLAIDQYQLVLGGENVTAWSSGVNHYSHGTSQANASAVWPVLRDRDRFGGWWPNDRPPIFMKTFEPTPDEARALFGAADRLPLFEAAFHDSVVALDRWEFGLMKVAGQARGRFARSLLFGTPTLWNLTREELARVGPWLKAAHDDFRIAHGWDTPVALTGFAWLSDDRLVQRTTFADGRVLTANFGAQPWEGLGPDCVQVQRPDQAASDLCPPADPPPAARTNRN